METTRITIPVSVDEREALRLLAREEMRDPREQVRYLLQRELVKRGMLAEKKNTGAGLGNHTAGVVGVNP